MPKILVVEDDPTIGKVLSRYLTHAGYEVRVEVDGNRALETFFGWRPALVLLDIVLPGQDGRSILKSIRERSSCPVIMLTALNDIENRLEGFQGGADDYIGKPFQGEEVVARVRAVLRRTPALTLEEAAIFGDLRVEFASSTVFLHGEPVKLAPRDLSLLLFLAQHPNRLFNREQLIERVWGIDYDGSDRAVDLSVKRIRQALSAWPKEQGEIQSVRGLGYKLLCHTGPLS